METADVRMLFPALCFVAQMSIAGLHMMLIPAAVLPPRYQRETVQQLAEAARRAVDMSDNAARPRSGRAGRVEP